MDLWSDSQGPPRKRMRKGTKSCIECMESILPATFCIELSFIGRRRKIRCTYKPDRPEACNECRLRGSKCIDQENGPEDSSDLVNSGQLERYSLRERVAHLEAVVQDLVKRLDEATAAKSTGKRRDIDPMEISWTWKNVRAKVQQLLKIRRTT